MTLIKTKEKIQELKKIMFVDSPPYSSSFNKFYHLQAQCKESLEIINNNIKNDTKDQNHKDYQKELQKFQSILKMHSEHIEKIYFFCKRDW